MSHGSKLWPSGTGRCQERRRALVRELSRVSVHELTDEKHCYF
nr:hypothetical protein [Klebsiella michiganensis]UGK55333.1 Hypothetical protein [Raoultella ornithinolytica]UMW96355.1 hypothetical protein [Raoultella ornithinolytica]UVN19577.1 hypothetical protein [Klebsiella michiganensis]UWX38071.1 hypothetical protein KJK04_p0335 [Klebsiella quasipneumoniae]